MAMQSIRFGPFLRSLAAQRMAMVAVVSAAAAGTLRAQLQFAELPRPRLPPWFAAASSWFAVEIFAGDFDRDGAEDLLTFAGAELCWLRNDGSGRFPTMSPLPVSVGRWSDLAVGDLDGDGDLDLVVANDGQNQLLLNDGTGSFVDATSARLPVDSDLTMAVVLGDVDGDGDLDIVFGNHGQQNRLYRNSGSHTGTFLDATGVLLPIDADPTLGLALGDIDGDGDLDLVASNFLAGFGAPAGQNRLYANDGTGIFADVTAAQLPGGADPSEKVFLVDIDSDGDLDLVVQELGFWVQSWPSWIYVDAPNQLHRNDGSGTFGGPVAGPPGKGLRFGDVDGDGDLDFVALSYSSQPNQLYLNDGAGQFRDGTARMQSNAGGTIALVDVDGDADLDMVHATLLDGHVLVNLQRQLDAPSRFRIGQTYRFDAYLRDPGGAGGFAFPFAAFGPGSLSLGSWGTLGVELATAFPLPLLAVPPPTGLASVAVNVPAMAALVGIDCYAQALLVPAAAPARLSAVVADRLGSDPPGLVVNGGFELGSSGVQHAIPGWTASSGCGIWVFTAGASGVGPPMAGSRGVGTRFHCNVGPLAFHQDVPTTPGRHYLLRVGYAPTPGNADNHVVVRWDGSTAFDLQQDGTRLLGHGASLWSSHRALVAAAASGATTRLEIADGGPAGDAGGLVDEVAALELTFATAMLVAGEVVPGHTEFQPLRDQLGQAATAAANNDPVAKAAALAAFVAAVNALPAGSVDPRDAALLVAIAGVL